MSGSQKRNRVEALGPNGIFVKKFCRTKAEIHKVDYLWIIDNYSFHHEKKSTLESARFTADTNHNCIWYLKLNREAGCGNDDVMGVFIHLDEFSVSDSALMKFELSMLDDKRNKNYTFATKNIRKVESGLSGRGRNRFILKDYLSIPTLFPDDKLSIYCQLKFCEVDGSIETSEESNMNLIPFGADLLKHNISKDFGDFFEKQELTDVTLSVNSKRYKAHKVVLAARSPVFFAMFTHNMRENENNVVEITDIEEKVVEEMLRYIYTDECKNLKDLASDLLIASNKYDLKGLKIMCEEVLINNLSVENAAETLHLADLHAAAELKLESIRFIAANSIEVMNSVGWKKCAPSYPVLVMEVCEALSRRATGPLE